MSAAAIQPVALIHSQNFGLKQVSVGPDRDLASLTRALVRGDEAAWVQFHGDYSSRIHRYLLVLLKGDPDAAAEVLQVTFTRIARHMRGFEDEAALWHWLARIARTCAIDELRKRGRREESLRDFSNVPEPAPADDGPWAEVLHQGLLQLDGAESDLLRRKYVEGMSVRELAAASGDSEKATESKLTRARNRLREAMLRIWKNET
jgi:RNA polymerase sigma-70 factor, ECF subfamily